MIIKPFRYTLIVIFAMCTLTSMSAQSTNTKITKEQKALAKKAKKEAKILRKEQLKGEKALVKAKKQLAAQQTKLNKENKKNENAALAQAKAVQKKKDADIKKANKALAAAEKSTNKKSTRALAKTKSKDKKDKFKGAKSRKETANANRKTSSETETRKSKTSSQEASDIYEGYGFKTSADKFLEIKRPLTLDDKIKIANSFRKIEDVENAQIWYSKVADESPDPIHKLRYAQALQSNGNNEKASLYFQKYADATKNEGEWDNIASILAKNVTDKSRFINTDIELKNEKLINSEKIEFSPTLFRDGVIFVTTRKPSKFPSIGEDPWIKENFMSLYYAKNNEAGMLDAPEEFSYDITTKFHEGPVSFSQGYNQIYFTRNNYNNNKRKNNKDGVMKLQIYTSTRDGDGWSTPEELSINTVEYEECHPSLNADGSKLYFASDRTGGYGGMDIYVSEFKEGDWSEPINLGPKVNTAGNEVFPFIHESGMLFYASNGKDGLGGLDVFFSKENKGQWSEAKNIGTPFNSKKDDFGFILNDRGSKGYITSSRKEGYGKDDIYSFELENDIFNRGEITICTIDEATGQRLANATVSALSESTDIEELRLKIIPADDKDEYKIRLSPDNKNTKNPILFKTDAQGAYRQSVIYQEEYSYTADLEGYNTGTLEFTAIPETDEYCIPLSKKNSCLNLNGNVLGTTSKKAIPFAKLILSNAGDKPMEVTANANGTFDFGCIPCGEQYTLRANKDDKDASIKVSTLNISCDPENNLNKDIYLDDYIAPVEPVLEEGQVIVLENIFYDFDKFYIRSDAEPDLNKVVDLMNQYPGMTIELGSHTDTRGTAAYNEKLSSNRAAAAVNYIVSRGIDPRRIIAKGYGETIPRNQCRDGIQCSEEEHQFNRRTEVKVISLGRTDIQVIYNDNKPDYIDPAPISKRINRNN